MVAQLTTGKYREFAANNFQAFKISYMNNSIEDMYFVINIDKITYVNCDNIQVRKYNTEINSMFKTPQKYMIPIEFVFFLFCP